MRQNTPHALQIDDPETTRAVPVLVDSPHSGRNYPDDFTYSCPKALLEHYEDRHVDALIADLPEIGATCIRALVPRCYIDLNRARDDVSQDGLSAPWDGPFPLRPTAHTKAGTGLIWMRPDDTPIYTQNPTPDAVMARIHTVYDPYYAALADRAASLRARFGRFVHLNMHSMQSSMPSDIVLGDMHGKTCTQALLKRLAQAFESCGYRVAINDPYAGVRLVELFGTPDRGSESIQIEINKRLYLQGDNFTIDDEKTARMKNQLKMIVAVVADYMA